MLSSSPAKWLKKYFRLSFNLNKERTIASVIMGCVLLASVGTSAVLAVNGGADPVIRIDTINGKPGPFNFVCPTNPLFNPVTMVGSGSGSAPPGKIEQYGVSIDWGDGKVETVPAQFTPDSGQGDFTFTFTAGPHVYALNQTYNYSAKLFHQTGSGNDNTVDGTITVTACVEPDPPATLKVVKKVINDDGKTAVPGDFNLHVKTSGLDVNNSPAAGSATGVTYTLAPGSYSLSEDANVDYTGTWSGDCAADGTITLASNQVATCTLTNDDKPLVPKTGTLTVTKVVKNDNGGTQVVEDFPLFVNGNPVTSGSQTTLNPGNYTVTETGKDGYAASFSGDCDANGNVTLAAGEDKMCTITNDDIAPTITVTKVVKNDNGGDKVVSDFALSLNGGNVVSGVPNTVNAGTYTVTEVSVPGYTGTFSGDCAVNGQITVNVGENKTCILTNDDQPATLTVTKTVKNDNGGTKVAGDFTLNVTGGKASPASFSGSAATVVTLDAGAYSVDEVDAKGYTKTLGANCSGTIANGESKTCEITNDDEPATLQVIKKVINDNVGIKAPGDFNIVITTAGKVSKNSFPGEDDPGTLVTIDAGAYSVDETNATGYVKQLSADCTGTIGNGESKTCTITNNDEVPPPPDTAHIFVIKEVKNDNNGKLAAADFTMKVSATNPSIASFPGASSPGIDVTVEVGSYEVTEIESSGYTVTYSPECSGTIAKDEVKTCTITNDDKPATLTVTTVVNNNYGGQKTPADFNLTVTGGNANPGTSAGAAATVVTLDAGAYSVAADAVSGYTISYGAGCTGTIDLGESKSCTVTIEDQPATLQVIKKVINDNGRTKAVGDFTMLVTAVNASTSSFPGSGGVGTFVTVNAGAYSVTELTDSDYVASSTADCTGTIANGETKVCEITNDDTIIPPTTATILIKKLVINDNGQSSSSTDFMISVSGTNPTLTSFAGSEVGVQVTLDPGAYSIDEADPTIYYNKSLSADCSGTLVAGDSKVCEITNNDVALVITNERITVNGPTSVTITWTTNHPATSRVVYDTASHEQVNVEDANYGYANTNEEDSTKTIEHSMTITGLTANTQYYFRPVSHGSPQVYGKELTATTQTVSPPGGGNPPGNNNPSNNTNPGINVSIGPGPGATSPSAPPTVAQSAPAPAVASVAPAAVLGEKIVEETEGAPQEVLGFKTLPETGGAVNPFVHFFLASIMAASGVYVLRRASK